MTLYPRDLSIDECSQYVDAEHHMEPMPRPAARLTFWEAYTPVLLMVSGLAFWIGVAYVILRLVSR